MSAKGFVPSQVSLDVLAYITGSRTNISRRSTSICRPCRQAHSKAIWRKVSPRGQFDLFDKWETSADSEEIIRTKSSRSALSTAKLNHTSGPIPETTNLISGSEGSRSIPDSRRVPDKTVPSASTISTVQSPRPAMNVSKSSGTPSETFTKTSTATSNVSYLGQDVTITTTSKSSPQDQDRPQDRPQDMASERTAWIISAGRPSLDAQAIALAQSLKCRNIAIKHIVPAASIQWLFPVFQKRLVDYRSQSYGAYVESNHELPYYLESMEGYKDDFRGELPDVVISSCEKTTLANLHVKSMWKASDDANEAQKKISSHHLAQVSPLPRSSPIKPLKTIHLHAPFVKASDFDCVVLAKFEWPALALATSLTTEPRIVPSDWFLAAPGQQILDRGKALLEEGRGPHIQKLNSYLQEHKVTIGDEGRLVVAVSIGGGERERDFPWQSEHISRLTQQMKRVISLHDGLILLHLSSDVSPATKLIFSTWLDRLTPEERSRVYFHDAQPLEACHHDQQNDNPYESLLAVATHIAVTAGNIGLVSECLELSKPLYLIGHPTSTRGSCHTFMKQLIAGRRARVFMPSRGQFAVEDKTDVLSDVGEHLPWRFGDGNVETGTSHAQRIAERVEQLLWGDQQPAREL
ncbi:hypothetical protein DFS34DRAFT_654630 [Phlyctochytrium arcticum]|nr:hypothetical protein DFS34DRAFT_654630 [Phlyctochytrium arcticum]